MMMHGKNRWLADRVVSVRDAVLEASLQPFDLRANGVQLRLLPLLAHGVLHLLRQLLLPRLQLVQHLLIPTPGLGSKVTGDSQAVSVQVILIRGC